MSALVILHTNCSIHLSHIYRETSREVNLQGKKGRRYNLLGQGKKLENKEGEP